MPASDFQHRIPGGLPTRVYRWLPERTPRGALQIVHGMAEHAGRYARLGHALSDAGFAVYAHDLPGHGADCPPEHRGHFADQAGWRLACASVREIHKLADKELGPHRHFLFGHSMGSYLVQHYMSDFGRDLAGAVLSATSGPLGRRARFGLVLLRAEAAVYGRRRPSAVGMRLGFKTFNRPFRGGRTEFDWLSRDPAEVDRYIADPACGFPVTAGLWIDLLEAIGALHARPRLRRLPRGLPVLVVGGSRDSAVGGQAGPRMLEKLYRQIGLADVTVRIYPDARHEVFNDTCREQATRDLVEWMERHVPK